MAPTISDLPEEMLVEVFKLLDGKSVKEAALICKEWNRVISTSPAIMKKFVLNMLRPQLNPRSTESFLSNREFPKLMSLERHFTQAYIDTTEHVIVSRLLEVAGRYGSKLTKLEFAYRPEGSNVPWDPHLTLKVLQQSPNLEKLSLRLMNKWRQGLMNHEPAPMPADKVTFRKLKKLEDKGNIDFYPLIEAPQLEELKCRRDEDHGYYNQPPFEGFEKFLKALSNLESLETNFAVFSEMDPGFPFQLKKVVASRRFELDDSIKKFLLSQAATVQTLEAECDNSEFHELVLTNFKQLGTVKANLDKLTASQNFYSALMPMPFLTEISSLHGFSSELAMRGVLENCPALKKLECKEDRQLPNHLEFVAEHNKSLEVLGISTVRETFATFRCLKELIVVTVGNIGHLVLFLKLNSTVEILDIQWLSKEDRRCLNISPIITETSLKCLKMNGFKEEMEAVSNQIKSKFGDWTKLELSNESGSLLVDIMREKRPRGTKRGHSSSI